MTTLPRRTEMNKVYQDLGTEILDASFAGYNACLFAYGQTGSGKTYTMMGCKDEVGLIPRICEGLCSRVDDFAEDVTCQIEVSYLEIYNERVRDLLAPEDLSQYTLKVREHPKDGPYVQDLSKHLVGDHISVRELIERGNVNRTTAATHMHDASSRSHAIFTINFTQATLKDNMPSEVVSKINLVDLAGSERADPNYSRGRLTEGANINKSLVTLGNCISALGSSEILKASNSLSAASMESLTTAEDNYTVSGLPRKPGYIPYRNSVLTWLLKDSLGGNSKTIMISTVSPASTYFNETMSTLRYARRAKHIVNKPKVNEDLNVRLIRELRAEIDSLKALLSCASLSSSQASLVQDKNINEILQENEQKVDRLTEAWVEKWREAASIMQECNVGIRRENVGVIVESDLPHLLGMDDDLLSTGIILYHLKEGETTIGREDADEEQDIILSGPGIEQKHCSIQNNGGTVMLCPCEGALCAVNGLDVNQPTQLTQGAVVLFGKTNMYRFNHPAEAAKLRERRASIQSNPERRVTRKNSITLKVPSSALNEEARQRSMSFSFTRDGNLIEEQDHINFGSALSPIMMYNSGDDVYMEVYEDIELERQHKMEVEKLDETRKRLAELQEKHREAEEAHQEREEKMRHIYQSHQDMIERQRKTLEWLKSEHAQAREDAEEEFRQMKALLLEEKIKGERKLKEELRILKDELTKKAMTSAIDACVLPKVVAMDTETSQHLTELDVDRKRVTQLELLYRESQREAAAELQEKERCMEQQRDEESQAIARAESKLADIENITFPWQRFSSRNSLESLVEETGSYSGESYCSNLDRVSPIGGRSDSDSNSGSLQNGASDNYNNKDGSKSGDSKVKYRSNSLVKNSVCIKKQNPKLQPIQKERTTVRNKFVSETDNRTMKKSAKDMPHKVKVSSHGAKIEDAQKNNPAKIKSSIHDRSPTLLKKVSPNIKKNINKLEKKGDKSDQHKSRSKQSNEPSTNSKRENTVFSRLYKPQTPKFQYLKKKDCPLYGRDWMQPPDRSRDYHLSQLRTGLLPSSKKPSPVRAKQIGSPVRGTPGLNCSPPPKINGTPRVGRTPLSSKSVPSSKPTSNSPKTPRAKHSTKSSPIPKQRNIHREDSAQSCSKNTVSRDSSNKAAVSQGITSANPSNNVIKPTRKSWRRQRIVVSPPKKVSVEYVKPKITKPKQRTPLNMTPRKTKHSESFYVPMKDKMWKAVAIDNPEGNSDYIQTERQPAIGCSRSMEDVTLGHGLALPLLDGNEEHEEHDFVKEQKIPSEISSAVDDFPDSLDEAEEFYEDASYTEPLSYHDSDSKNITGESLTLVTTNENESDISCDSLDDEDTTQTNHTMTPVSQTKENNPFAPHVLESQDFVEDIQDGISDKQVCTSVVKEMKDNSVELEETVNFFNDDDRKRKPLLESSFKDDTYSESDDEINEHAPPAKKSRRLKKSRNHQLTCPSSESESEDTYGVNLNGLAEVKIEISDENNAFQCGNAVHVPLDDSNSMSDSSASVKISNNGDNSDIDGSLNLSGHGNLSESFNWDILISKDVLSSEEMPPLTEDKPAENSNYQIKYNDKHLEEKTVIETENSIINNNMKQNDDTCEDQFTEDSDSDSSSEDSMEGGDYYVSAGIQVKRPLADITEEVQSSENEDTDSSQSTDTYSSPFSSADEEESVEEKKTYSIDEKKTYNVYDENEGIFKGEEYSSTDNSESFISDEEDCKISESSSEENLQDTCQLTDLKDAADSPIVDKPLYIGFIGLEPSIHICLTPSSSEQDRISDILPYDPADSQEYVEEIDVETNVKEKSVPKNLSENKFELENVVNDELASDKEKESPVESMSILDEQCSEELEDSYLDTTITDEDVHSSVCDGSGNDSYTCNGAPELRSINVLENKEQELVTNDSLLNVLLLEKDRNNPEQQIPDREAENILKSKYEALDDVVNAPNQRKMLLQVGIQNSSTGCESADELPCTEHRLVGQNFAIANAQLKMIALLLGNKSAIYDSDESNSPERMESPQRKVPTSPKNVGSDGFKISPVMDKGIFSSVSGDVHKINETVIKSDTVKADRLPQNLALISTFDSPQSPVMSHVVAVDYHKGDIVNISTNIKDPTVPDTDQHDQELNKSIKECDKWRENGEIIFAKTDGTRFPPEGNVDSIYSENVSNVSKLTMLEMETQTEEQRMIQGNSQLLPKGVDQKQVQEKNLRKSVCGDYEVRTCSETQTEAIITEIAVEDIDKNDDSTECSSNLILDMNSGISVAMQTDMFQEEYQEEVSIPVNDNVSIRSRSYLENTVVSNHNTNNRHMMVSVATLTISDDTNNIEDTERMILEKYVEQNSMTTCDAATSPDYLQPSNENYIFEPTKEHERYGGEHRVPGNKTKNAETQYEDNSEILPNSSEMLHMVEEPKALLQHKMSNEVNIINVCDTKDTGTQVQLTDYSACDILECNIQQMVFTKDEGSTHILPQEEVIAASTQTDDNWKRSVVCQTDPCEQSPRVKWYESREVLKISRTSMAIQTDNCQEIEAIDTHGNKHLPSAFNELYSETPIFSDSGIQVYLADEIDHFKKGRTSCHTCQDEYLFNDNVPSLVNQGIQTEPTILDISSEVNSQSIESESSEIILEEEMPVDDISDHHPHLDSEMSVESEVDAEESSVVPIDASPENNDLQFLERIKEIKDKAQHVASRARMFTSKLRLSNMNDSAESLDHPPDDMPQDQDIDFLEKSTENSLESEERISTCNSAEFSNAEDLEIDHTPSREDGNQDTKRSELNSIILNTETKTLKQITFTLKPELSLVEMERPSESALSGSDDGYDYVDHNDIKDDDKDDLLFKLTTDKTNNKEISSEDDLLEHTEIVHTSYGDDDCERNDNMTSQLRLIQLKSQAVMSNSIACTPPSESALEEPVLESASSNSLKEIVKHQGNPSHYLETGDNTGEETEVVNFAKFKLMLCEQYVQQNMVLSEVRSFWQQLKEEEEEQKVKDTIQDENSIPKLEDIREVPKIKNFPDENQKVNFNHQEENNDQAMDVFKSQILNRPTGTIIYHVDEENVRKLDDNMIQPHMNHDFNNSSNTGNLMDENNIDETMKTFEDVEPSTASVSEIISCSTDEIDGSADHKAVESESELSFANEDQISCDSVDSNKVVSQALKYKLHQLPTINYLPENNDISDSDKNIGDGDTKELQTSEQYVWSKFPTNNKTVSGSQSSNDHNNLVNNEGDLSTDVMRHDPHKIHTNEDLSLNELVCGKPEQEEVMSAQPGYHYRLKDCADHKSSYSQKIRFLGEVDKQVVNLPTYNVNFDLDESDEDLRALKKSHEDVERILEETSSPDSDLEDSAVEPELVALMEEIENDHISADLAKQRLDPPSLTENRLCSHALKVPVSYRSSNDSQNNTPKNSYEPELDNHCLEPQDMRINVKPLSPFRPDWLTENVLENGMYNTSSNSYLHIHRTCSPFGTKPVEIDRLNSLEMVVQEKGDILKVTERSSIQMKYQEASSYNNSPYQSGISTPKSDFESSSMSHIGKSSSLTVENLKAIGALPRKFLSKTSIPLQAGTDVEILSDFQDEIPTSNTDVSGREKQRASTDVEQEDTNFSNSMSAETGNISDVLSDIETFSDYKTIDSSPPHNSLDAFSKLKLAMDSSTQTDVPSDTTSLLQDDITEVDQALSSSDSDHFHISIASPGSRLDRHDTSVELMEAKMMHGIGETDAWLRFLESDNSLSDWMQFKKTSNYGKQHHSIGQIQKENLERPHTSNGHYSSPLGTLEINHLRSNSACMRRDLSPVGRSRQPSRQLEYLQKLRQDVVKATSQTETASENSGIDELLAEYQRTREQSQAEITKAKEKLKQQTKKEKQRLKDEMKYLRDIENQTTEARIKAEDHIRDERKRIFLEERQLLRIKDWRHRRTSSEQDVDIAIMNLKKARDSTRYSDRLHGHPSQLNRTWHGTSEESKRSHQPLPNYYVSSVHRQSFSDRSSVASGASSGRSFSPPSTDRSNTRSSLSIGSDRYVGSPVSDVKSSSPEVSYRNSLDYYHHSSFSTDDELSPRYSYELSRPSGSFHGDVISANSVKNAKIKMMADPMLVEARYKESLERIKRYEKSSNCFHGHHQRDRRGRSREHTQSYDERLHQVEGSPPDALSLASVTPHRRAHTFEEQILQPRQVGQQDPNHNYRNYQAGVGNAYRDHPAVVATGDSDWEY
ncbi:uncharacterized protein LOC117124622 [Anneissia japonica]|uniref:uncharacterized protein LOC117124622 n=1 Tax=Anneissia japonica TaxID=1529436 RepID=UPI0014259B43|nr:uncharacterized protein LOC117124622 [Anneissia japonica]